MVFEPQCHDVHIWLFLSMVSHFIVSMVCITLISKKQRRLAGYEVCEGCNKDSTLTLLLTLSSLWGSAARSDHLHAREEKLMDTMTHLHAIRA